METSKNLFGFEQIGVGSESDSTLIFEEIRKEEEDYLLGESDDTDKKFQRNLTNYLTTTPTRNVLLGH